MNNYSNIYIELGSKLKAIRQAKRFTITEIANRTKIKQNSISKYESGKDRIPVENLLKICDVLNIDANLVLYSSEDLYRKLQEKTIDKMSGTYDKVFIGSTGKSNIFYNKSGPLEYFFVRKDMDCEFVIKVTDNSMDQVIKINSYVGIDINNEPFEGQIYLFNLKGIGLIFKRIIKIDGKKDKIIIASEDLKISERILTLSKIDVEYMKLKSIKADNPFSRDHIEFQNLDEDFIIGKGVWIMHSL